jgi:hypothetical protein
LAVPHGRLCTDAGAPLVGLVVAMEEVIEFDAGVWVGPVEVAEDVERRCLVASPPQAANIANTANTANISVQEQRSATESVLWVTFRCGERQGILDRILVMVNGSCGSRPSADDKGPSIG